MTDAPDEIHRPSLMPSDTPDYMAPAWASCMSWAIGDDDIRNAFERESGMKYVPPKNGLERMIDDATGHGRAYVEAFVRWANENVWGEFGAEGEDAVIDVPRGDADLRFDDYDAIVTDIFREMLKTALANRDCGSYP